MNHLVNQIKVSGFKGGTLRFYGQWYGRPYDNFHRFINATSEGNCLILEFDNGDVLRVWDPEEVSAGTSLLIEKASGVEFIGKRYIPWDNSTALEIISY